MIKEAFFKSLIFIALSMPPLIGLAQSDEGDHYRLLAVSNSDSNLVVASNKVQVFPLPKVFLPNAFTPNGDGLNDTFGIQAKGLRSMQLRIFDRWGKLVFEADDPNQRWDGTVGGKLGQIGVYAYSLSIKGANGTSVQKEGSIMLIN